MTHYVSVNGNANDIPKGINYSWLESYYRYFLTDRELVEKYFPSYLKDDLDHDYEVEFCGSLTLTTNDNGTITFDWTDNESGEVNCSVRDDSVEAQSVYEFLTDKTRCKWFLDDYKLYLIFKNLN